MTTEVIDLWLFPLGKNSSPLRLQETFCVILDSNLTSNGHIVSTLSSWKSRLGQINHDKPIFDKRALIIIINALVFSNLFYCSSVWSNTTQANLDKLREVQNLACRILGGAKTCAIYQSWNNSILRLAVLVFKCTTVYAPEYLTYFDIWVAACTQT